MKNDYLYFDQFHIYCFGLNIYTKDSFDKFLIHATKKYGEVKVKRWQENTFQHFSCVTAGNLVFMWLKK